MQRFERENVLDGLLPSLYSYALYDTAWQHQPQRVELLHSHFTNFQQQVKHACQHVCYNFNILSADKHPSVRTDV